MSGEKGVQVWWYGTSCGNCIGVALACKGLAFGSWFIRLEAWRCQHEPEQSKNQGIVWSCNMFAAIHPSPQAPSLYTWVPLVVLANQYILACVYLNSTVIFLVPMATFLLTKAPLQYENVIVSTTFARDYVEWTKDGSIFVQTDNSYGGIVRWKNSAVNNVACAKGDGEW